MNRSRNSRVSGSLDFSALG